ncbi:unnamed protein product [Zymoseptoria tritici ST99CH_1A5]|uniref:Uncharacterized protein n=2 Tax=Zymoseptoria tritici TaxID=1047171 RepID=A0A1X7RXJ4_ZYMT9|nr:unnamed protein product [Zymoseptoria tritici ST99CH_3D7]SMR57370.1 unnamed protein product [Zymoseptoria tritici ST99CH_3D1]SMY25809.1 unnamed protein product [Zymoseptoria tritici ST99CH_1A5]
MKIQFLVLAVALGVKVNAILINGCMSNAGDTCHRWAPCCASNSLVCHNNKCESCVAVGGVCEGKRSGVCCGGRHCVDIPNDPTKSKYCQ